MSLLEQWRNMAYNHQQLTKQQSDNFWMNYFGYEKTIYEQILADPKNPVKGTVKELAEKFNVELMIMVGFLDGINDSLKTPNPIETMEEDTEVSLDYDIEGLYMRMVDAKAEWLYTIPAWDELLTEERRRELYHEGKLMGTVIKGAKIGRNDPCPCGSGLKYKKCCGKNA